MLAFADDPGTLLPSAEAGVEAGRAVLRRLAWPCSFLALRRLTAMLLRRLRRSATELPALMSRRRAVSVVEDILARDVLLRVREIEEKKGCEGVCE